MAVYDALGSKKIAYLKEAGDRWGINDKMRLLRGILFVLTATFARIIMCTSALATW